MDEAQEQRELTATGSARFLVVLVLYRMCAESSPAFQSLQTVRSMPGFGGACEVLLWDNSPEWQPGPKEFDGTLIRDPQNPGLALPYNTALQMAAEHGIPWLVLLDQDTLLTDEYTRELMQATEHVPENVAVILPQLVHRRRVVSPAFFRATGPSVAYGGGPGLVREGKTVQGFNSGAALRVAAMQTVGGFNPRFPLDYLDHATFAALQRAGGGVWALKATLEHSLSSDTGMASTAAQRERQESVLSARRRFLRLYGTAWQRLLFPLKALREAASLLLHKSDVAGAMQVLRHLFSL